MRMNSSLGLFLIEIAIALLTSGAAAAVLSSRLRGLLLDACGTVDRARFWVMYSGVMLFIAPLLAVIVFGQSGNLSAASLSFYKSAFGSALAGVFVALAVVGLQLAKVRPQPDVSGGRATDAAAAALNTPVQSGSPAAAAHLQHGTGR
jgi:hypothetical protein